MEKLKIGPPEKSLQTAYITRFLEDSEVDVNGDGKFNFDEFMKMCRYEIEVLYLGSNVGPGPRTGIVTPPPPQQRIFVGDNMRPEQDSSHISNQLGGRVDCRWFARCWG